MGGHPGGQQDKAGRAELVQALRSLKHLFFGAVIFSMFVNLLMLTGPVFMLQIYDRVISSRSMETLIALFILVGVLFLAMGLLDFIRARVLARAGARFFYQLDMRVFEAILRQILSPEARARPVTGLRDLEAMQKVLTGPAPLALFDAPWTPIYLAVIFLFHNWLGWLAVFSALLLLTLTMLSELFSRERQRRAVAAQARSENFERAAWREAETVWGLGMHGAVATRWRELNCNGLRSQMNASDRTGGFAAASKGLRYFLQSAMLALGAALVIRQEITAGTMIVASILMGRALSPIEMAISQWGAVQRAAQGWRSLSALLSAIPAAEPKHALPMPTGRLTVRGLSIAPPGSNLPIVRDLDFDVTPGEAVGVIGPSGSGKSTLAKVLTGIWPPISGEVRLDGALLGQWDPDELGRLVGYLPQDVGLMNGTVAENISRLTRTVDPPAINAAAMSAEAHEMILRLSAGYDTPIGVGGTQLSGGQRQRIAFARALYGDPVLLVLDEPNAHLDLAGERAMISAIDRLKALDRAVIVIAHRQSILAACQRVLVISDGRQQAFGPRNEVFGIHTARPGPVASIPAVTSVPMLPRLRATGTLAGTGHRGGDALGRS